MKQLRLYCFINLCVVIVSELCLFLLAWTFFSLFHCWMDQLKWKKLPLYKDIMKFLEVLKCHTSTVGYFRCPYVCKNCSEGLDKNRRIMRFIQIFLKGDDFELWLKLLICVITFKPGYKLFGATVKVFKVKNFLAGHSQRNDSTDFNRWNLSVLSHKKL